MASQGSTSIDVGGGWLRAALGLAVLAVLNEGDAHGYALAQRIGELGLAPVRGGALYPVLGRLESEGAVTSSWQAGDGGPGRKVYSMSDEGRVRLQSEQARWREFADTFDGLLAATTKE